MTQRMATQEEAYLAASESFESNGASRDPSWARDLRKAAITKFRELGFPTSRRGNEEWKYTDIGPVARVPVQPAASSPKLTTADVEAASFGAPDWPQLVFVNGRYDNGLSSLASLPEGVTADQPVRRHAFGPGPGAAAPGQIRRLSRATPSPL